MPALTAWDTVWRGCAAYSAAGATVMHGERIRWFATGVDYEGLNGVFVAPGTPVVPVPAAARTFDALGVPALWHVAVAPGTPPATQPIAGLTWYEAEPLLVAPVGRVDLPHVDRLSVIPAQGVAGVRTWVRLWSGRDSGPVFDATVRARVGAGAAFTHLLAVLAGEPVGCAAVTVAGRTGEVQHVATDPAVRGRGIGTTLTAAALRALAARGVDTAVLTASPAGAAIYRRFGFRQVGEIRRYLRSPAPTMITRPDGGRNITASSSDIAEGGGYPARAWVQRPAMPS
jgi:ribosomal protein S18 acetylase RimI-like enzyme